MGFREDGTCPMLADRCCTIYPDRPRTCRDYDCRIYAAARVLPDGDRPVIKERVAEWEFSFADDGQRSRADSVARAARFIRANAALFPPGLRAHSATAAAVLAVKVHHLFTDDPPVDPEAIAQRAQQVLHAARAFDGR